MLRAAWQVVFYEDAEGQSPVWEFLRSLPAPQRARLGRTIRLLQEIGTALGEPHARYLGDGLWELRTQVEGDAFRCLYVSLAQRRFLILHAFQKKTQKIPRREIDTARRRCADWRARNEEAR